MRISEETRAEIRAALTGKRGLEARHTIRDLAARLGVSEPYLYQLTAAVRATGRTARRDAGARRVALTPEIETFMEGLTRQADMSADHVLFITARHFGLADDWMSTGTYNAWLRRQRQSRRDQTRDLRPYRSFEAAKANDLQHYDTTVAEAYYVNDDGSIGFEPGFTRYKNKPGNKRPRLILYAIIDDCSRVLFARFYVSENTFNLLDFLFRAWSQKPDKRWPAFGIPAALYADLGKPLRSEKARAALDKLGVRLLDTTPSSSQRFGSRKHGKIERTFGEGLLGEFMKLTLVHRFASLDELNETLHDWLIRINNKVHSVTKEGRFARWLRTVGTPRSMPGHDLYALLHYEHVQRVVAGNLQLSVNGKTYQLPYKSPFINWVGVRVEVYWYPGKEETISVVYDHQEHEIQALAPVIDLAEDYKRVKKTTREARVEQLDQVNFQQVNIETMYRTDLPYLPKKGARFDEKKIAEKTVTTKEGRARPSFAPQRWLNKFQVAAELSDYFDEREARNAFVLALMNGREQITEDDVTLAKAQLRARDTGTEG